MRRIGVFALAVGLAVACEESDSASDKGEASEADSKGEDDDASSTAPATQGGSTAPTGDPTAGSESGGELNETGVVRFIAMGDAGEGNDGQYNVAAAIEQVCADRGCEFALYLGDNFYDVGVDSTMDVQFQDKFELPYADIDFPFYITLGNHDYGIIGNEWTRSQYQVDYTDYSDKWTLPSEFYSFDVEHATFISLDTARLFWNYDTEPQREFIRPVLEESPNLWRIAFGHHPYISNGEHGNAGNYEGAALPLIAGAPIKEFFDEEICDKITVYICGHDHTRQWHPTTCGTEFIVAGAGSKTTGFAHRDGNPEPRYQDDTKPGFVWVELQDRTMKAAFFDYDGNLDYEDSISI